MSKQVKIYNLILAVALTLYAIYSWHIQSLWLPAIKGASGVYYTGDSLSLMLLGIFFGVLNLLITLVDFQNLSKKHNDLKIMFQRACIVSCVFFVAYSTGVVFGYFL
jgi:ABC-type arginine transport system permease subunit